MSEPLVCAVMLTKDRLLMAARAIISFRAQTYQRKKLLIVNSGKDHIYDETPEGIIEPLFEGISGWSTGALRNHAAKYASTHYGPSSDRPEIFVHFDDDDWSHPRRIEEQVALLVASGKECVGYNQMLFWDSRSEDNIVEVETRYVNGKKICFLRDGSPFREGYAGEAWLFQNKSRNYALGTSLCYWRSTWEKHPFPDKMRGEDYDFVYGCDSAGCSSLCRCGESDCAMDLHPQPRMIASIHAGNGVRVDQRAPHHWTRAAQFDDWCRKAMAL